VGRTKDESFWRELEGRGKRKTVGCLPPKVSNFYQSSSTCLSVNGFFFFLLVAFFCSTNRAELE
jgi:hypothetical protein